jgi:hypothetical protein
LRPVEPPDGSAIPNPSIHPPIERFSMNARPFGIPLLVASLASATLAIAADPAPPTHFDPKGKPPSQFTIDVLNQARETLPFSDTRTSTRTSAA